MAGDELGCFAARGTAALAEFQLGTCGHRLQPRPRRVDGRLRSARRATLREITLETDSIRGGAVAGEGFSPRIAINRTHYFNDNESGRRFTIAHELCHVLFDRTRARRVAHASSGGPWAARGIEQRANAFAAYLLMPRTLVLEHLAGENRIGSSDIKRLASGLKVNESALLRHLRNLGLIDAGESERLLDELGGGRKRA